MNSNGTRYATADHLGSPRVVTNSSAAVVSRHDYKAFGEELGAGVGGRTTGMGFSVADNTRQKFTGQERDTETGLDYFDARYYGNTQGRFTSVDPLAASASPKNPQTFNRYAYALNSPYRFNDPSGMMAEGYAAPTGIGPVSMSGFDEFSLFDTEVTGHCLDDSSGSQGEGKASAQNSEASISQDPVIVTCNIQIRLTEIDATKGTPFKGRGRRAGKRAIEPSIRQRPESSRFRLAPKVDRPVATIPLTVRTAAGIPQKQETP